MTSQILDNLDTSAIPLSSEQRDILSLLSAIEETQLQLSLLNALNNPLPIAQSPISPISPGLQATIAQAERDLLESRARYILRNKIVTQTIIADPILQAVHTPIEEQTPLLREIKRVVDARDVLNMVLAETATRKMAAEKRIRAAEREVKKLNAQSKELAGQMLVLAEEMREDKTEDVQDDEIRTQLELIDVQIAERKKEWRQLKSFVAGIVVASGVDWAKDEKLIELVMDDEDEGP